ncbi:hypothetical protein AAMO2058_001739500 [Amorphochlora amoebiformis]
MSMVMNTCLLIQGNPSRTKHTRLNNAVRFQKVGHGMPGHTNVLISTLVYEEPWYVKEYLSNLLNFTQPDTLIVVHICKNSPYAPQDIKNFKALSPRIYINCNRFHTESFYGSIVRAHISNFEFSLSQGLTFRYALLKASNAWFVKPNVENFIQTNRASLLSPNHVRGSEWVAHVRRIPAAEAVQWLNTKSPPRTSIGLQNKIFASMKTVDSLLAKNDNNLLEAYYSKGYETNSRPAQALWDFLAPERGLSIVGMGKHEGSYYPGQWVREMVNEMNTKHKYLLHQLPSMHFFMEEILIQTWMIQKRDRVNGLTRESISQILEYSTSYFDIFPPLDEASSGQGITAIVTFSHNARPEGRVCTIKQVSKTLRNSNVYAIKAISRGIEDVHGTRAYLKTLSPTD